MEELKLIGKICNDLDIERHIIIKKYVLPLLDDLSENVPCLDFRLEILHDVFKHCLGDVMNNMKDCHISCLLNQNFFDINRIYEFKEQNWERFNYYGKCDLCETWEILDCCEGLHNKECEYVEVSSKNGCGKKLCYQCVEIDCSVDSNKYCKEIECDVIRCDLCAF